MSDPIYNYLVIPTTAEVEDEFLWHGQPYSLDDTAFNNFFGLDSGSFGRGFAGEYGAVSVVINNSGTWDITNEEFVVDPQPEASSYGTTSVTLGKFFNNGTINLVCTPDDDDAVESISFNAPKFNNVGTFTVSGKCTVEGTFTGNGTVIFKGGEITTDLDNSTNNLKTLGEVASTITGTLTGASFDNTTKAPTLSNITLTLGSEADPGSFKGAAFLEGNNTIVAKLDPYNEGAKDSIIYVRADNVGLSESTITGGTIFLGKSSTFPVSELNVYGGNDFDGTVLFLGYKNTTLNIEDAVVTGGTIYNTQTLNGVVNIVNAELGEADDEDDDTEEKKVLIENKGFTGPSNTGSFSVSADSVIYASTIKNSGTFIVENSTIFAEEIIDNKRSANNTSVFSLTDSNLTAGELTIEATKADFTFAGAGTLTIGTLTGTITALDGAVLASSSVGGGTLKIKADSDVVFYGTNSFGIIDNAGTITVNNSLDDVSPASLTATSINGEIVLADNVIGTNPEKKTYMVVSGLETETVSEGVTGYDLVLFNKAAYLTSVDANAATVYVNSDYTGENGSITNEGYIVGYNAFSTLADAAKAANNGTVISVGGDDILSAASAFVCGGNVTITGTAVFDWGEDWMFVGRGEQGDTVADTTVIFKDATITRAENTNCDRSIHISGAEKDAGYKKDGTVMLDNSSVVTEYIINKNQLTVKTGSTLTVNTYLNVSARPKSETPYENAPTAHLDVDSATVSVSGNVEIGNEGNGEVNLSNGAVFNVDGTVTNYAAGTIKMDGFGDLGNGRTIFKANELVNTGSFTVSGKRNNLVIKDLDGEIVVQAQDDQVTTLRGKEEINNILSGDNTLIDDTDENVGTVKIAKSENTSNNMVYIYDIATINAIIQNNGIVSVGNGLTGNSAINSTLTAKTINNGAAAVAEDAVNSIVAQDAIVGSFTVAANSTLIGAEVNNYAESTFTVNGTLNGVTVNDGTITSTTGFTFAGSSALNGVTVSANGKTITNTGTLTVTGALTATGVTIDNTNDSVTTDDDAIITIDAGASIAATSIKGGKNGTIVLDATKFTGTFGNTYAIASAALTDITTLTIATKDKDGNTVFTPYENGDTFTFNNTPYTVMISATSGIALAERKGTLANLLVNAGWDLPVGTQVSLGGIDGTIGYNAFKNLSFLSTSTSPEDYLEASKVVFAKGTEYTLSAYTYFYADNESGKTTLTTAVPTPPNASDAVKIDGNRFYLMGKVKPAGEATTINAENYFASAMTSPAHIFEFADGTKFVMQQLLVGWGPDSDDINDDGSIQRQVGKAAVTVSGDLSTKLLNLYQFSSVDVKDGGTLDVTKGTKDASSVNSIVFAPGSSLTVTASAMPAEGKPQFKANRLFFNDGGSATFTGTRVSFAALTPSSKGAVSFVPEDFDRTCTVTLDGSILDAIADAEGDDSFFKTDGDYGYAKAMVVTIKNGSTVNAQNKTFNVLDKVTVNVGLETGDTGNNTLDATKITNDGGTINVYNGSTLIAGAGSTNDGTINVIGTATKKSTLTIKNAFVNDVQPSGDNNKGTGRLRVENGVINYDGNGWIQNTWQGVITLINADVNVQVTNRTTLKAENTAFTPASADKRITADAGSFTLVATGDGKSSINAAGGITVNASGTLRINNTNDRITDASINATPDTTTGKYATQIETNTIKNNGTFQAAYADITANKIENNKTGTEQAPVYGTFEAVNATITGTTVSGVGPELDNNAKFTLDSSSLTMDTVDAGAGTENNFFKVKGNSTLKIGWMNDTTQVGGLDGKINVVGGAQLGADTAIYKEDANGTVIFDAKNDAATPVAADTIIADGAKIYADIENNNAGLKVGTATAATGTLYAGVITNKNGASITAGTIEATAIYNGVEDADEASITAANVIATGDLVNEDGSEITGTTLVKAVTINNDGTITGGNVETTGDGDNDGIINNDGTIKAANITASKAIDNTATLYAGVVYDTTNTTKIVNATGKITAGGNITNSGKLVAGEVDATGFTVSCTGDGDFTAYGNVKAGRIDNGTGTTYGSYTIMGKTTVANAIVIKGKAAFYGDIEAGYLNVNNADGEIDIIGTEAKKVTVKIASTGAIRSSGKITATNAILDNNNILNAGGSITVKGASSLKGVTLAAEGDRPAAMTLEGVTLTDASVTGGIVTVAGTNNVFSTSTPTTETPNPTNSFTDLTVGTGLTVVAAENCLTVNGDLKNEGTITIDAREFVTTETLTKIISVTGDFTPGIITVLTDDEGIDYSLIVQNDGEGKGVYLYQGGSADLSMVAVNYVWLDVTAGEPVTYNGKEYTYTLNAFRNASEITNLSQTSELNIMTIGVNDYAGIKNGELEVKGTYGKLTVANNKLAPNKENNLKWDGIKINVNRTSQTGIGDRVAFTDTTFTDDNSVLLTGNNVILGNLTVTNTVAATFNANTVSADSAEITNSTVTFGSETTTGTTTVAGDVTLDNAIVNPEGAFTVANAGAAKLTLKNGSIINAQGKAVTADATVLVDDASVLDVSSLKPIDILNPSEVNPAGSGTLGTLTGLGTIKADWKSSLDTTAAGFTGKFDIDVTGFSGSAANKLVITGAAGMDAAYYAAHIDNYSKYFTVTNNSGDTPTETNNLYVRGSARNVTYVNNTTMTLSDATTYTWLDSADVTKKYHTDNIVVTGGSYADIAEFQGIKSFVQAGTFSGTRTIVGSNIATTDPWEYARTNGDYSLTVNSGATFNTLLIGGDRLTGGSGVHTGVIEMTINGGQFNKNVAGGMLFDQADSDCTVVQKGDINMTITGGTFLKDKSYIYGGNVSSKSAYSENTIVNGDITITIDTKDLSATNKLSMYNLAVGSYGAGTVRGTTTLVLTGENGDYLSANRFWGGCGSDVYEVTDTTKTSISRVSTIVDGKQVSIRTLSFVGYQGGLDVGSIKMFNYASFDADTHVDLSAKSDGTGFRGTLAEVENWTFEYAGQEKAVGTGAFNNDFKDDNLNFEGLGTLADGDKWLIFDDASKFTGIDQIAKINDKIATFAETDTLGYYSFSVGTGADATNYQLAFTKTAEEGKYSDMFVSRLA